MPLSAISHPRFFVLWLTMGASFFAIHSADALDPDKVPVPPWKPPTFLLSRTLPIFEWYNRTAPQLAADFEPWNTVLGPDGYYYGYVNDGGARNGLIHNLRPFGFLESPIKPHPAGEAGLVYRFPVVTNPLPNRMQGSRPHGGMAVGQGGAIYGRLSEGGAFAAGLLFKLVGGIPRPIHHFVEKGNPRNMVVAANGDIYSATAPEDPSQAWWLFRISKDGGSKNIPAPAGEITALRETTDQRLIVGTSNNGQGALWRLTAADEFELVADHAALLDGVPHKLLALPGGEVLCLTSHRLLRVRANGTVITALEFRWADNPSFSPLPTFLLYSDYSQDPYPSKPYEGSFKIETTDPNSKNLWFTFSEHYNPPLQESYFGDVPHRFESTWMDISFKSRVFSDRRGTFWGKEVISQGHLPPLARDDVVPAGALTIGPGGLPRAICRVLGNDADPERSALRIIELSAASHGFVKTDATSQFAIYTANSTPVQNDSFTYTISDGDRTATARVFIRTNSAGRYTGEVIPAPSESSVQSAVGSLLVNLRPDRSLTGRLEFEGRVYRFTRRFNAFGQCAAILMTKRDPQQSLAIQLFLRPDGTQWTVDAVIRKDNTAGYTATCTPQLR